MKKKILALDISTNTGFAWSKDNSFDTLFFAKREETNEEYAVRLYHKVMEIIRSEQPDLAVIENYAFGSMGRGKSVLSELGGVVKLAFSLCSVKWVEISPSQWKSYLFGQPFAKKEDIKILSYKKFGVDFSSQPNDLADAYCLWRLAHIVLVERPRKPLSTTAAYEKMVKELEGA